MENDSRNQEVNKAPVPQTADIVPDNAPACQKDVVVRPPAASPGNGTENHVAQFPETEETKKLKENYGFFGISIFLYAVFYTFCMFRNGAGVTFPLFVAGSLLLLFLSLSKLGMSIKRGSIYYMVGMILLGISTFLTDDWRIIFYNKLGVFLLMISLLLKQFFDTSKWNLGKYFTSIIQAVVLCLGELLRPVQDGALYQKNKKAQKSRTVGYVLIGLAVSVPLLLIVLALLASADAFFLEMVIKVFGSINLPNIMNIIFRIGYMFFFSYMLIAYLCRKQIKEEVKDCRTGEPVIAITVTAMLTFVYLLFSIVQIAGLFLGKLQLPEGYTYAGYARRGFFQLLVVSILNLIIVLVCLGFFRKSKILKGVLTVMSLCTFIMIASSATRMAIYIHFYYLTFMRILVLWALALLTVLFLGVLINIYAESFPLFRYSMAVVTIFYLVLSFARPDYIIAKVNISNAEEYRMQWWEDESEEYYCDFEYLGGLSADAAPVLVPYMKSLGYDFQAFESENALSYAKTQCTDRNFPILCRGDREHFGYWWMRDLQRHTENFGIRTFNLSRYTAMELLRQE
ncbi:MAG: DUF4173 domain-containing protein [Lachnospiraceae bacterium]|jgi:hypothetical protein|nr:DUF4173 domain-containing protein [Lachnospiraceae bacterium]